MPPPKQFLMLRLIFVFFFNDTATTEIYTLSLHDALPIFGELLDRHAAEQLLDRFGAHLGHEDFAVLRAQLAVLLLGRSEEHTSELQSQSNLVCRLLLEKKKITEPIAPLPLHDTLTVQIYT